MAPQTGADVVGQLKIDKQVEKIPAIFVDATSKVTATIVGCISIDAFGKKTYSVVDSPVAIETQPGEQEVVLGILKTGRPCCPFAAHAHFLVVTQPKLATDIKRSQLATLPDRHQLQSIAKARTVVVWFVEVAKIVRIEHSLVRLRTGIACFLFCNATTAANAAANAIAAGARVTATATVRIARGLAATRKSRGLLRKFLSQ